MEGRRERERERERERDREMRRCRECTPYNLDKYYTPHNYALSCLILDRCRPCIRVHAGCVHACTCTHMYMQRFPRQLLIFMATLSE